MSHFLIAVGAVIAVIAVTVPIGAILLVSVASRREESEHTLSGHAPGAITRAARRLLAYRAQADQPAFRARGQRPQVRSGSSAAPSRGVRAGVSRPATVPVRVLAELDPSQDSRQPAGTRAA